MANTTDKSILTAAGKALLAQLNAEEKPLIIDKMIFANVPNRPEFPQPDDVVPTDHVVHQEGVEQRGRLSADSVIYSTTLTSDVGPFEFNWTGAYCSEYGVLVTIDHHALTPKTANEPGVSGNTLVRSVVLEYKDIAEITNITVDASSWQYNADPRMKKMDNDTAQAIIDQNGKDWFIEDGFLVTPQASAFNIKAGAGYVSGNRVMLEFDRNVQVPNKPSFIYVDAHREGTPIGEQVTLFDFVVTAEEKDDYIDVNGVKHFVCKIAQVLADGSVSDLRPEGESANREYVNTVSGNRQQELAGLMLEIVEAGDNLKPVTVEEKLRIIRKNQADNIVAKILSSVPTMGLVESIDLTPPYSAVIGGQKVYLADERHIDNFGRVSLKALGARDGDDISSLLEALFAVKVEKIAVDGDFVTSSASIGLAHDIDMDFAGGFITHVGDHNFDIYNKTETALDMSTYGAPVYKAGFKIFDNDPGIEIGDIIQFRSSHIAETTYNTPAQWVTTVANFDSGTTFFEGFCRFPFNTYASVSAYHFKRVRVKIRNLNIDTTAISKVGFGIRFFDLVPDFDDISMKNSKYSYCFQFVRCVDHDITRSKIISGTYPYAVTGGANAQFEHIRCKGVRHPVVVSRFADGVWIRDAKGSCGIIESHPAFNVNYDNIDMLTGTLASDVVANLRAVGGSIRNAKLRHVKTSNEPNGIYVQLVNLVDPTPWKDADFVMENVDWYRAEEGTQEALPLDIYYGGRLHMSNVKAGGHINIGMPTTGKEIADYIYLDNVKSDSGVVSVRGEEVENSSQKFDPEHVGDDTYSINMLSVAQDSKAPKVKGKIYRNSDVGQVKNIILRIQPSIESNNAAQNVIFKLTLKAGCKHQNAGVFATVSNTYNGFIKNTKEYSVILPSTPVFSSDKSGQSNETLEIKNVSATYIDNGNIYKNYVEITFDVDAGYRTNPVITFIDYELEMYYE
ncbi:hypothetical protein BOO30_00035 [Vibrio navarrensis]|uniref:phage tail-collar fiber domain-containing protein n=1 Tax=Vibrio navarrensis TaxID=29495 RepID=UPI001D03AE4D|nr:phage tail protein [Vibrio navarrensis]MBE4578350.1 hypothetical protein [Vibrio navarrensis]MBE4594843.1 hypothetical protein [Vibrio navarrensis]